MSMSNELITVEVAIKTTWMILNGLGYFEYCNPQLADTIEKVFETAPKQNVSTDTIYHDD